MESTKQLAQFLGHRGDLSFQRDFFAPPYASQEDQWSTRRFFVLTKGQATRDRFSNLIRMLIDKESPFWVSFWDKICHSIAEQEQADPNDFDVILDDFSVEYPSIDTDYEQIVKFSEELIGKWILELLEQNISRQSELRAVAGGHFTLDIEGIVPWPAPDPDLVFEWEVEVKIIVPTKAILFSCLIRFDHVEGPGLRWLLGAIGVLLGGGVIGFLAGFAVGEIIDLPYESQSREDNVIQALTDAWEGLEGVLTQLPPGIEISHPDARSVKLSIDVLLLKSAFEGLLEEIFG
jgi:phage tail protein X